MKFLKRFRYLFSDNFNEQIIYDRCLQREIFEHVGDVLIVHIPIGLLPPGKAEELIKLKLTLLGPLKDKFKVKALYVCGYRYH